MEVRKLKIAYKTKAIIATALILLAIAFAVALFQSPNVGGKSADIRVLLLLISIIFSYTGMDHRLWLHIVSSYILFRS